MSDDAMLKRISRISNTHKLASLVQVRMRAGMDLVQRDGRGRPAITARSIHACMDFVQRCVCVHRWGIMQHSELAAAKAASARQPSLRSTRSLR